MSQPYQIIAVDFDGTLCYSNWPELGEPNKPLIEYLRAQQKSGNKLILWTCRAGVHIAAYVGRFCGAKRPRCVASGHSF